MSRNHALYFPYINVPSTAWFTQALLYWDSVRTIVPEDFSDSQFRLDDYSRAVLEEGLVESIHPAPYLYRIPAFSAQFIELLESHLRVPSFRRRIHSRSDVASVHVEKLHDLVTELQARNLAGPEANGWVSMPGWLANLFMSYLAAGIGQIADFETAPITNNPECWANIVGTTKDMGAGGAGELQLSRDQILAIALPVPAELPEPRVLATFKRKHRPLLRRLRVEVEATAAAIACAKSPAAREAVLEKARQEVAGQIEEVADAMKSKWKIVFWSTLAALPVGYGAGKVLTGAPISGAEATFAALTVLGAAQKAIASANAHDRAVRGSPYAYAAAYRLRFSMGGRR